MYKTFGGEQGNMAFLHFTILHPLEGKRTGILQEPAANSLVARFKHGFKDTQTLAIRGSVCECGGSSKAKSYGGGNYSTSTVVLLSLIHVKLFFIFVATVLYVCTTR
jgi:hypothetical protein